MAFEIHRKDMILMFGDKFMFRKKKLKIPGYWINNDTTDMDICVERDIDPILMINKTLI